MKSDMIQEYMYGHLLWRYMAILDMAWRLSSGSASADPLRSVPLHHVLSWERGLALRLHANSTATNGDAHQDPLPIVRCTFDAVGLAAIERLPERPAVGLGRHCDDKLFIVERAESLRDVAFHSKKGFGHLQIQDATTTVSIWNTPSPHDDAHLRARSMQLRTIDTRTVTGLTFLYSAWNGLTAIHCHTARAPSAMITAMHLSKIVHERLTWTYVPLPAEDRLVGIGRYASRESRELDQMRQYPSGMPLEAAFVVCSPY